MERDAPDARVTLPLRFVRMRCEVVALARAALEHDFDEARFRVHCIRVLAADASCIGVWRAAREVSRCLGPQGALPAAGYGRAFASLTERLASGHP